MRVKTKVGVLVALAATMTVLLAAPASAHEQIDPSSFPVGKPTFLTLRAANEEKSDLTKIVVTAPKRLPFGTTTQEPAGWTVNTTEAVITWTGGAVKPDAFDQWGFEIDGADQPGTYTYNIALSFADGKTNNVKVPVTAVAAGAAGAAKSASSATSSSVDAAKSRANAALAIGIVAIVLALVATVLAAARRRKSGPGATSASAEAPQDW